MSPHKASVLEEARGTTITTKDGTQIYCKDWGTGQPVVKGGPHGICTTHKDQVNADLLAFIKA